MVRGEVGARGFRPARGLATISVSSSGDFKGWAYFSATPQFPSWVRNGSRGWRSNPVIAGLDPMPLVKPTPKNKRSNFAVIATASEAWREAIQGPGDAALPPCLNYAEAAGNGGVAAPGWLRRKSSSQ